MPAPVAASAAAPGDNFWSADILSALWKHKRTSKEDADKMSALQEVKAAGL